eukprot:2256461-Pleurochrysis_carterae.AAC.3
MPSQVNRLGTLYNFLSTWLDDLLPWLPTSNASYASLIKHGYTLTTRGWVVVYPRQHAQAVFFNLYTPYAMDAPSQVAPTLVFPTTPAASGAAGPTTRSTPAGATPATALLTGAPPVSSACPLTANERDHFIISPEQLASVDRQLMETIPSTIALTATRPAYHVQCMNSSRTLIRILAAEANASSPSASLLNR